MAHWVFAHGRTAALSAKISRCYHVVSISRQLKEQSLCSSTFHHINLFKANFTTALNRPQSDRRPSEDDDTLQLQDLYFPGGKVKFTSEMKFLPESLDRKIPCFRVLDDAGHPISLQNFPKLSRDIAIKMYKDMVTIQIMDSTFFVAQRQGRISFYMTSDGEEAVSVASAAALKPDDIILPQYREQGALLWRGFTIQDFANQCFGNKGDVGKGRQMPVHYGSKKHNYLTISSPLGTQLPQAVGVAYSLKMDRKDACSVTYFGDGSSSEGDFHAALNFAAVMDVPMIFICRNNGWAISTPCTQQFRSDGIVVKGQGYGIRSIRVDGNDAVAVYETVRKARTMAIDEQKPILIEVLTYRAGHHSTSDDSTKYRSVDEIEYWKIARSPVGRFRKWMSKNGWWDDDQEAELQTRIKAEIMEAIQVAEKMEKPPVGEIFTDVYDTVPMSLLEQEKSLRGTIEKHAAEYRATNVPLSDNARYLLTDLVL